MPQVTRRIGILYAGLFFGWVLWFCLPAWIRAPYLADQILSRRIAPFLVCLLLSHWLVRRGEFWAAVFPLVVWSGFMAIGGFYLTDCGTYVLSSNPLP